MTAYSAVPATVATPAIQFGAAHSYTVSGDLIMLSADLDILDLQSASSTAWALQLWAIDAPCAAGELHGIKIAEVALDPLPATDRQTIPVAGSTFAWLPAGVRDWHLLLALAAGTAGDFHQIHAIAPFPNAERFVLPYIRGTVGYRLTENLLELKVDEIHNPRAPGNTSGTLSLELWALTAPYAGGAFEGVPLAGTVIGSLPGQEEYQDLLTNARPAQLPPGHWHLVLMLREWTAMGYITRDYTNFALPYVNATPQASETTQTVAMAASSPQPAPAAQPEPPVEATPAAAPPPEAAPSQPEETVAAATVAAAPETTPDPAPVSAAPKAAQADDRISVNQASATELAAVKGLSKSIAKSIIACRPFTALKDLLRVKGVGSKTFDRIRDRLKL